MAGYPDNLDEYLPALTTPPTADTIAKRTAAAQAAGGNVMDAIMGMRVFGTGPRLGDLPAFGRTYFPQSNNPATQNAVVGAQNANKGVTGPGAVGGQQALVRKSEQGAYNPAAPVGGSVSPNGTPYTSKDVGGGVTRFDVAGQNPLYTNLGVAGLEDIQRKGPALASVPSFLGGLQEGDLYAPAQQVAAQPVAQPGAHADQIAELVSNATPYLRSQGIAANWRGRMLLRQARGLSAVDTANQNAQANTISANAHQLLAQTQVPLALMRDATTQRGQNFELASHLPQLQLQNAALKRLQTGDLEGAHKLLTLGAPRTGYQPRGYEAVNDVSGAFGGIINRDTGAVTPVSLTEMRARQQEDEARRAAATAALNNR